MDINDMMFPLKDIQVDVPSLREWYLKVEQTHPITFQGVKKAYGGWSFLSLNGGVEEGWTSTAYIRADRDQLQAVSFNKNEPHFNNYTNPTPIYTPEIQDAVFKLRKWGMNTFFRGRIAKLWPNNFLEWHIDARAERWRVHIPLITEPECRMHYEVNGIRSGIHMPADGRVWAVRTDYSHAVEHSGINPRIHVQISTLDRFTRERHGA